MRLEDIYKIQEQTNILKKPIISFEVFPPRDNFVEKSEKLIVELTKLMEFSPKLISVTYGAGGSTKANSVELVKLIKNSLDVEVMPHLTCLNSDRTFIESYLAEIESNGIENVLSLRGDVPMDEATTCGDFQHANELVEIVSLKTKMSVGVAGYPEAHYEANNLAEDIDNLKKKVDAGAKVIFTQLFFDNSYFYDYVEKVRAAGITIPIIPGILPITSCSQVDKMTSLCKVRVPEELSTQLCKYEKDHDALVEIGKTFAINQSRELMEFGVQGLHFFILNKSQPVSDILREIL